MNRFCRTDIGKGLKMGPGIKKWPEPKPPRALPSEFGIALIHVPFAGQDAEKAPRPDVKRAADSEEEELGIIEAGEASVLVLLLSVGPL